MNTPLSATGKLLQQVIYWATLGMLCFIAAELTARFDDWMHIGVPFLATPDHERDLIVRDGCGNHGKPHGRFKKWQLNAFGFRGHEIDQEPATDVTRIMVLGASEMFGLYESDQKEFPVQLANMFRQNTRRVEVVNASVVGLTVKSMVHYWQCWASKFHPHLVLVYPNPQFYLNERPRAGQPLQRAQNPVVVNENKLVDSYQFSSRWLSRMRDLLRNGIEVPRFLQRWRTQRMLDSKMIGKSDDWLFRTVPEELLHYFIADLTSLTRAIVADGAEAVIMTHAMRAVSPLRPQDLDDLFSARVHVPRATEEIILAFEEAATQSVIAFGRHHQVPIIDVAKAMNGKREWFGDLVHFTDAGAEFLASLVASHLSQYLPPVRTTLQMPQ